MREAPPTSTGGLGGVFAPTKPLVKKEGGLVSQIASKFQNPTDSSAPGSSKLSICSLKRECVLSSQFAESKSQIQEKIKVFK